MREGSKPEGRDSKVARFTRARSAEPTRPAEYASHALCGVNLLDFRELYHLARPLLRHVKPLLVVIRSH